MTTKNKLIAMYCYIIFMYMLNVVLFFVWVYLGSSNYLYYIAAVISIFATVFNGPGVYKLFLDIKALRNMPNDS